MGLPTGFEVLEVIPSTGPAVITATGELDRRTVGILRRKLAALLDDGRSVVLNLAGIESIDAAGFNAIMQAHVLAAVNRCSLLVESPSREVARVFQLMGAGDRGRQPG